MGSISMLLCFLPRDMGAWSTMNGASASCAASSVGEGQLCSTWRGASAKPADIEYLRFSQGGCFVVKLGKSLCIYSSFKKMSCFYLYSHFSKHTHTKHHILVEILVCVALQE